MDPKERSLRSLQRSLIVNLLIDNIHRKTGLQNKAKVPTCYMQQKPVLKIDRICSRRLVESTDQAKGAFTYDVR